LVVAESGIQSEGKKKRVRWVKGEIEGMRQRSVEVGGEE
jgi:hypothetical protein